MRNIRGFVKLITISFILCIALFSPALAQDFDSTHAKAKMYVRTSGPEVRVAVVVEIEEGWHVYHSDPGPPDSESMATTLDMKAQGVAWSEPRFPKPEEMESLGMFYNVHEGTIVIYVRGEADGASYNGKVRAFISGVACSESCMPFQQDLEDSGPGDDKIFGNFPGDLKVENASSEKKAPTAKKEPSHLPAASKIKDIDYDDVTFPNFEPRGTEGTDKSLGIWLLIAFVAGIILNVMPCVLPVVSIKILSFVQQAGEERRRVFALGVAFAAGMLLVFWVLAGVAITLGIGWGGQFESQAFKVTLIAVVFAFSLSLLDVFTLGVPKGVGSLASGPPREGMADAFFKGMLATVMATPCSGPFLGGTLAWTLSQPAAVIFLIFTAVGLGMALPYVILTAFPGLLKIVPKPGPWMVTFKHIMGFVMLGTLVFLIWFTDRDLLVYVSALLVFIGLGCWFWGRFARPGQKTFRRMAVLAVTIFIFAGGAYFSFVPLKSILPTKVEGTGEHALDWIDFDPELFDKYRSEGRSVLVDFTADWCLNCKYNENMVYDTGETAELVKKKNIVTFKADLTHAGARTEMLKRLRAKLGIHSVPLLAVFPGDEPGKPYLLVDLVTTSQVIEILEACPDPQQN